MKAKLKNIFKEIIGVNIFVKSLAVFAFFLIISTSLYMGFTRLSSSDDHYFHFKFAEVMRENGVMNSLGNFETIPYSKIAEGHRFENYNFLFYYSIIPFTYLEPLFLGIKLYAVFAVSLAFLLLFLGFHLVKARYPFVYTISTFALLGYGLLWRFFLSRPYALAPALLIIIIAFLYQRRYKSVALISFLYFFWHGATFFFPLFVCFTYFVAEIFHNKKPDYKKVWAPIAGLVGSIVLVYIISPGFFVYIKDNVFNVVYDTVFGKSVNIAEGGEVYPKDFFDFIGNNIFIVSVFIFFTVIEVIRYFSLKVGSIDFYNYAGRLSDERRYLQSTFFFLTLGFFIGTVAVSGRFMDFFAFFVGFYIFLSLESLFGFFRVSDLNIKKSITVGLLIAVSYLFANNSLLLVKTFSTGSNPYTFAGIGNWLNKNVKKNDVIFNVSWNWLPQLYYYFPQGRYVAGLEPRFMYEYNPKMFWLWSNIEKGIVCESEKCEQVLSEQQKALNLQKKTKPSEWFKLEGNKIAFVVKTYFKSNYIVSINLDSALNSALDESDYVTKSFDDGVYRVYAIHNP